VVLTPSPQTSVLAASTVLASVHGKLFELQAGRGRALSVIRYVIGKLGKAKWWLQHEYVFNCRRLWKLIKNVSRLNRHFVYLCWARGCHNTWWKTLTIPYFVLECVWKTVRTKLSGAARLLHELGAYFRNHWNTSELKLRWQKKAHLLHEGHIDRCMSCKIAMVVDDNISDSLAFVIQVKLEHVVVSFQHWPLFVCPFHVLSPTWFLKLFHYFP
jgi:hypothetical protein